MRIDRAKNASRNIMFGVLLKLYQVICPFIIRTAMIYLLGMEYVGLNSLFNSILQVLNLTELGVGTAMVFSMYKPIADEDHDKISKLMELYKVYYRIIGFIIAVIGLAITPIIPKLISGDSQIPLNIYYLYWINLGYTVLSYWLFAYKNSILQAHQRNDIISKITLVANTATYLIQFSLLILFKNYYLYLLGMLFGQALNNIITSIIADRMYPQYKAKGKLSIKEIKEINQRVKDLFTSKIGGVIQNSVDTIVISAFLGLTLLAKYNNYYYIMNSLFGFIIILFNSCLAGIGNSLVVESKDKNYQDFKKISLLTEWLAGFCSCCLLCLYQPFMKLWVGEKNTLEIGVVICIAVYFYIIVTNQMLCLYKDAAGIWHKDRYRPLVTALVNLSLNLASVKLLGLYGVVLSTVISMLFVGMPWLIHNLFSEVFNRSSVEFVKSFVYYALTTVVACTVTFYINTNINDSGLITLVIKILICLIVPNTIILCIFCRNKDFSAALQLVNKTFGNIIQKIPMLKKYL